MRQVIHKIRPLRHTVACVGVCLSAMMAVAALTHAAELEKTLREQGAATTSTLTLTDVPTLIDLLDKDDPSAVKPAHDALLRYAYRVANTNEQEPLAQVLCEHLADRDKHPRSTRMVLCRVLGFVGDNASVTTLYKAMNEADPPLQEMARWALVQNPSSNATFSLIGGLQTADGDLLVGVINGLGERGDVRAAPALAGHISNGYAPAARAALDALARLPHPVALDAIQQGVREKKTGAIDALLDLANNLIEHNMQSEAAKALLPLVDSKNLGVAQRCRWLRGLGRLGGNIPTHFVMLAVDDENAHIRGAALSACALLPGSDATTTIARKAKAAAGPLKLELMAILGERSDQMSDDAADFLIESVSDEDPAVRAAAIDAISSAGLDRAIGAIIAVLDEPDGPARQAAERIVYHMPGQFVTKQIIYTLRGRPGDKRATLVRALGRRGDKVAVGILKEQLDNEDPDVRTAAQEALRHLEK